MNAIRLVAETSDTVTISRADFEALHRPYETRLGLVIPRPALLVRGVRP